MPDDISISNDNDYIIIKSSSSPNLKTLQNTIDKTVLIYKTKGIDKVFVDSTEIIHEPNLNELSEGARYLCEKTGSKLRFSILVSELYDSHSHFSLSVGMNFGLVRYFVDKKEALKWLLGA